MLPADFLYKKSWRSDVDLRPVVPTYPRRATMITESMVVDVSEDWVVACGLQERFMEIPCAKAQTLACNARCRQMRALGGDCFQFAPLPGRRVALAVADASGKGLPAALIMANTDGIVETTNTASEEWGVEGLLAAVQHCRTCQPESVVDAAFAALDEFSGENQTDDATILAALVH